MCVCIMYIYIYLSIYLYRNNWGKCDEVVLKTWITGVR